MKLQGRGGLGLPIDIWDMFLLSSKILDAAVRVLPFASANVCVRNPSPLPLAVQLVLMWEWTQLTPLQISELLMWLLFPCLVTESYCSVGMVSFVISFPVRRVLFFSRTFTSAYFFLVRHYVITKIYSYLIMIYCSHLFCQLWHIFSGICKSDLYRNLPGYAFQDLIKYTPKSFGSG